MTASHHSHSHSHEEGDKAQAVPNHTHPHATANAGIAHPAEAARVLRLDRIGTFLEAHFGDVQVVEATPKVDELKTEESMDEEESPKEEPTGPSILIKLDEHEATIGLSDMVSVVLPLHSGKH